MFYSRVQQAVVIGFAGRVPHLSICCGASVASSVRAILRSTPVRAARLGGYYRLTPHLDIYDYQAAAEIVCEV
jgi:hypothetical protein